MMNYGTQERGRKQMENTPTIEHNTPNSSVSVNFDETPDWFTELAQHTQAYVFSFDPCPYQGKHLSHWYKSGRCPGV